MYCGYVVEVKELRKHGNADRLNIVTFFGNDVVVGLDTKLGDIGLYFPTDGQLGEEFAIANDMVRRKDENGKDVGGYLDPDKRNIKAIKLRKEQSDGLYMPLKTLEGFTDTSKLKVGDTISEFKGIVICQKYIPKTKSKGAPKTSGKSKKKEIVYPFFEKHIDTAQLAYNLDSFKEGDLLTISLKMHGTSHRVGKTIVGQSGKFNKLLNKLKLQRTDRWKDISGSRNVTLHNMSDAGGFYKDNSFRKKWHDEIAPKLHKGETAYLEIVGYVNNDTPIMSDGNNAKVDKDFVKKYGDTTRFSYGCANGESDVYVYRMTMTNEDGYVVEYPTELIGIRCDQMGLKMVPIFNQFIFTTKEDLMMRVAEFEGGADPIGLAHIREGIVVRVENAPKFKAYKHKNFEFKVLEGIIKDEATEPDMEEADGLEGVEAV